MDMSISAVSFKYQYEAYSIQTSNQTASSDQGSTGQVAGLLTGKDKVDFGKNGTLSAEDAIRIVNERMMEKLRGVVSEAQKALGISDTSTLDTSAEATAGRIADFALGAFDKWRKNHSDLGDDEARKQFADFIGGAIKQGISEASDILQALNAMTPQNTSLIQNISDIIQQRLDDFVAGNKSTTQTTTNALTAA